MNKAFHFIFYFFITVLLFPNLVYSDRGLSVISDLSHHSGKVGEFKALIIAINEYKDPKIPDLTTAVNDAQEIARILKNKYGFKVSTLFNGKATKKAIYNALRDMAYHAKENDSVLIYYAGHGELDRQYDDGWWIPSSARAGDPVTYLDNVQVQKAMRSIKARHVLLISDSCYSGTLFGQATRSLPPVINDKYYVNLYNEKSRWGMTSGNKTPVADSGTGKHSVFAYELIKVLKNNKNPFLSTQEIYTRIAPIVSNNSEQTPLCRPIRNTGDQGGSFVFILEDYGTGGEDRVLNVNRKGSQDMPSAPPFTNETRGTEIKRAGNFIAYDNGTVLDKSTGLMWAAKDNRKNINWYNANSYCQNYRGGGYTDWRLPSHDEVTGLYTQSEKSRYGYHVKKLINISSDYLWISDTRDSGSGGAYFTFTIGGKRWDNQSDSEGYRALPVRSN